MTSALVGIHKFWRVPGEQPSDVLVWFESHLPPKAGIYGTGTDSGPGWTQSDLGLAYGVVRHVLAARELSVSVTTARGGGTAIRIDADDAYWVPRPKWERIPAGVRTIDASVRLINPASRSSMTITAAAKIAKVVSLVNSQPQTQPYMTSMSCPDPDDGDVTLKFFGVNGNAPLATVVANASDCGRATVTLHGKRAPDLGNGFSFDYDLGRLFGFRG